VKVKLASSAQQTPHVTGHASCTLDIAQSLLRRLRFALIPVQENSLSPMDLKVGLFTQVIVGELVVGEKVGSIVGATEGLAVVGATGVKQKSQALGHLALTTVLVPAVVSSKYSLHHFSALSSNLAIKVQSCSLSKSLMNVKDASSSQHSPHARGQAILTAEYKLQIS